VVFSQILSGRNPAKPLDLSLPIGLICVIIVPHRGSGVKRNGVIYVIDQILSFYAQGKLSEEAALAGIIRDQSGIVNEQQLANYMHKSVRQIRRYISELSNLSPVSKLDLNNNKLTNQQELNSISEVLSKYGKLPLLSKIHAVFVKHKIEPNAEALEYIVQYVLKGVKCKRVNNFSQYLQYMIPVMWGEALVETAPKEDIKENLTTETPEAIVGDSPPERPNTDHDAEQVWQRVSPTIINQSPKATAEMVKRMIPVNKKDSTLYLAVESDFLREWILHKAGNLFSAAFNNICMNYEIILDQDVLSKIA
jgi:hypothetical protein